MTSLIPPADDGARSVPPPDTGANREILAEVVPTKGHERSAGGAIPERGQAPGAALEAAPARSATERVAAVIFDGSGPESAREAGEPPTQPGRSAPFSGLRPSAGVPPPPGQEQSQLPAKGAPAQTTNEGELLSQSPPPVLPAAPAATGAAASVGHLSPGAPASGPGAGGTVSTPNVAQYPLDSTERRLSALESAGSGRRTEYVLGGLAVAIAGLGTAFVLWQNCIIRNEAARANIKDRFEMFTRDPVLTPSAIHRFPVDFMLWETYDQRYRRVDELPQVERLEREERLERFIQMYRYYLYLGYCVEATSYGYEDDADFRAWAAELVLVPEFQDVCERQNQYYPRLQRTLAAALQDSRHQANCILGQMSATELATVAREASSECLRGVLERSHMTTDMERLVRSFDRDIPLPDPDTIQTRLLVEIQSAAKARIRDE